MEATWNLLASFTGPTVCGISVQSQDRSRIRKAWSNCILSEWKDVAGLGEKFDTETLKAQSQDKSKI